MPFWRITSKVLVTSPNDFPIERWKKVCERLQPKRVSQAGPRNPTDFYTAYERFTLSVVFSLPISQIKLKAASGAELRAPGPSACSQTPGWENWVSLGLVLPYDGSHCNFPPPSESHTAGTQTSTGGHSLPVSKLAQLRGALNGKDPPLHQRQGARTHCNAEGILEKNFFFFFCILD